MNMTHFLILFVFFFVFKIVTGSTRNCTSLMKKKLTSHNDILSNPRPLGLPSLRYPSPKKEYCQHWPADAIEHVALDGVANIQLNCRSIPSMVEAFFSRIKFLFIHLIKIKAT